jgi:predicted TIM-barrel fold metal-dependent hydrolase
VSNRYEGPIIDAHHHLWDLSLGRHPWITSEDSAIKALGDISFMRHDYLPEDYLADAAGQKIVGSVCIEALWDRARPPDEEVAWLKNLPRPAGIGARCVAWADLAAAEIDAVLDLLAAQGIVAGLRETIRWHPDAAKRWTRAGILDDPAWRKGFSGLGRHGFLLEVLMNPYQAEEVARLADDFPDQRIVVNHCGTPVDRDAAGLARWRAGLALMAARPNVAIKLSNYANYAADQSVPALRAVVMICLDAFGPERALFGTDYPVARRAMAFQDICERFKDIVVDFSAAEQRMLFCENAAQLYGFGPLPTSPE